MIKILIALDYDPTAQKVAEVGFALSKAMNAETILIHVLSDVVYYSSPEYSPIMGFTGIEMGPVQLESMDGLTKATQHFLDKVKHHLGDDTIQTVVVANDDKAEGILKTATESHADIIAMGSHGRKWLEKIVMGSVTEKVLSNTSIPLYIIPTKKHK
jgi:nucleotide-binding universal stress UspA family protein